ncbi:MAG: hypothetical protein MRY83_13570 [Flavobacteriales bacterium]|nr:hypothetical protein [Flavobacteriales bacterium]
MIIRLFRSNQPSAFVYLAVFSIAILIFPIHFNYNLTIQEPQSPLFLAFHGVLHKFEFFYQLFWITTILFQATMFNIVLEKNGYIHHRTHIPALVYVIFCSLLLYIPNANAVLFANTFLLVGLNRLIEIKDAKRGHVVLFSSSIWISISALLYFPYILYFIWIIITQRIFDTLNARNIVISLIGFGIPFLYLVFAHYMWSEEPYLQNFFMLPRLNTALIHFKSSSYLYLIISCLILLINLIGGFYFMRWYLQNTSTIKKGLLTILSLSLVGLIQVSLVFKSPKLLLIPLVFSATLITSYITISGKRKFFVELTFVLLMGLIVAIQLLT